MEIGDKCKLENDNRIYAIIDHRRQKTDNSTDDTLRLEFVDLMDIREIENPDNIKRNISAVKLSPVK